MHRDREIYVDTQYAIPPHVDGIIYVNPGEEGDEAVWQDATSDGTLTVDESDESNAITQTPTPLEVIEQEVRYAVGGNAVVNAILTIEEVPYVSDYEIRVVPR